MARGQIEVETLVALAVVLVIFVGVMLIIGVNGQNTDALRQSQAAQKECNEVAAIINYFGANQNEERITIQLSQDANVYTDHFSVGGISCDFFANALEGELKQGGISIYESEGVIILENI